MNKKGSQISMGLLVLLVLLAIFVLPDILNKYNKPSVSLEVKVVDDKVQFGTKFELYMKITNNLNKDIKIKDIKLNNTRISTNEKLSKYFPEIVERNSFVEKKIEAYASPNLNRGQNHFSVALNYTVDEQNNILSSESVLIID